MTGPTTPVGADEKRRLSETRRDLHRHPELGFAETRTASIVADRLRALGLAPRERVGRTGIVADFGPSQSRLMIRADMDALPIEEESGSPWRSESPGVMHACGHDGHVSIALETAARLVSRPSAGSFRFLFQPAEEGAGGAEAMVADGALAGVGAALGLHLWNQLPVGKIGLSEGPMMAAVDEFEIVVTGPGGHGAAPHETADTILASARIVEALQSIVAREVSPLESAVVSIGAIHGGSAFNVIPKEVRLSGTARSFSAAATREIPEKIQRIVQGTAAASGVSASVSYRRINRATVNDSRMTALVAQAAEEVLGAGSVVPQRTMGGEDMSVYLDRVPGCFFFVGSALEGTHRPHHSPSFDFDERALSIGLQVLEAASRRISAHLNR